MPGKGAESGSSTADGRIGAAPRFQKGRQPPATSSAWLRAIATRPVGIDIKCDGRDMRGGIGPCRVCVAADRRRAACEHIIERHDAVRQIATEAADMTDRKQDRPRPASRFRHGAQAPTRDAVTMALAPTRPSAPTISCCRHSSGSGAAIMPARSTPRNAMMLSTVFGSCMADDRVGRAGRGPRSLAASAEIARSACAKVRVRGAPSVKLSRLGGSTSASASGWRTPARRNRSSSVGGAACRPDAFAEDHGASSRLQVLLPPGFRQIAEQRGVERDARFASSARSIVPAG